MDGRIERVIYETPQCPWLCSPHWCSEAEGANSSLAPTETNRGSQLRDRVDLMHPSVTFITVTGSTSNSCLHTLATPHYYQSGNK